MHGRTQVFKASRDSNTGSRQRNKYIKDNGQYGIEYEEWFLGVGEGQH